MAESRTTLFRYLSIAELAELLGVSVATVHRMKRRGELPPPTQISLNRVGWAENVVAEALATRTGKR